MNLLEKIILSKIKHRVAHWFALEQSITKMEGAITSVGTSPMKSWPDPDKITTGEEVPFRLNNITTVGPKLSSCVKHGMEAISSIQRDTNEMKTIMTDEERLEFEKAAQNSRVGAIGYTKLPPHLIFKDRAVLYDNAIVLLMEMDQQAISMAPSKDTFNMVMSTYDELGIVTNKLTEMLRNMGFKAHASHPLGGLVLYPPLAVEAGLGWIGRHGLLITPEFGPRQRISAIFFSASNHLSPTVNEHSWIEEFCDRCGKCIKSCPSGAIMEKPIIHEGGRKTQIVREKCLPVFVHQQGCTICVKQCAFSAHDYDKIRRNFKDSHAKSL